MIVNEFPTEVTATGQTLDKAKVILVERKLSDEQQANLQKQQNVKDEEEIRRLIGVSMLMEKIAESVCKKSEFATKSLYKCFDC